MLMVYFSASNSFTFDPLGGKPLLEPMPTQFIDAYMPATLGGDEINQHWFR